MPNFINNIIVGIINPLDNHFITVDDSFKMVDKLIIVDIN
jgi:hypothetical protein